jgi:mono/diheme cytochrome c family protein
MEITVANRNRSESPSHRNSASRAGIAGFLLGIVILSAAALQPVPAAGLSDQDKICIGCHGNQGFQKKLGDGDNLSLQINSTEFAASVHGSMGCAACHTAVDLASHPGSGRKIASARSYALAQIEVCKACHDDKFKQYEGSVHASLMRDGNPVAPVCTDCHSPHAVHPKAGRATRAEVPCQKCHGSIYEAYMGSVHGKAFGRADDVRAPVCSDCHYAHAIAAASTAAQPRSACYGCHQNLLRAHQEWLPNAATHLRVISCAACHVPNAKRRIDLRLYDTTSKQNMQEKKNLPQFEALARSADAKGQGLDAMELQKLLKQFRGEDGAGKTTLNGRLEVSDGAEGHQIAPKAGALRDCAICHRAGGAAFQSVTVSIIGADGRTVRYDANKDVMNSLVSFEAVRGFYAIGSTRIPLLDWLLVLALLSGIAVPVIHQSARWLFRRQAQKRREDAASGAAGTKPDSDEST